MSQVKLDLPAHSKVHWCNLYWDIPCSGWENDLIYIELPNGFILDADELKEDPDDLFCAEPHYMCAVVYPKDMRDGWTKVVSTEVATLEQLVAVLNAYAHIDWVKVTSGERHKS